MTQRTIDWLIGRLITDEEFRGEFLADPRRALREASSLGLDLSAADIEALVRTDPAIWPGLADAIDPRLQKASLKNAVARPAGGRSIAPDDTPE